MKGFQKREIWFNENIGRKLIRCYKDFNRLGAILEKWLSEKRILVQREPIRCKIG